MAEILIVKPKTLNATDKAALRKAGVVVVEAVNPSEVRFLRAQSELAPSDLALAAMKALDKCGYANNGAETFVKLVSVALEEQKAKLP